MSAPENGLDLYDRKLLLILSWSINLHPFPLMRATGPSTPPQYKGLDARLSSFGSKGVAALRLPTSLGSSCIVSPEFSCWDCSCQGPLFLLLVGGALNMGSRVTRLNGGIPGKVGTGCGLPVSSPPRLICVRSPLRYSGE